MNKLRTLFSALLLLTTSGVTYAAGNGYCNARQGQNNQSVCYTQAINSLNEELARDLSIIDSLPRLSNQWKTNFHHELQAWSANVNNVCQRRVVCTYDSIHNEINAMGVIIYNNK